MAVLTVAPWGYVVAAVWLLGVAAVLVLVCGASKLRKLQASRALDRHVRLVPNLVDHTHQRASGGVR